MVRLAAVCIGFHAFVGAVAGDQQTVVVTGATGKTGSLVYKRLKSDGSFNVRAFVRNSTKAKAILGCSKCDESEGVFVGDLTKPSSVAPVMKGADVLVIATASEAHCTGIFPVQKCSFPPGASPKDIDWLGSKTQVQAFASAGGNLSKKHILYASSLLTYSPDNFLDKLIGGHGTFYHLNAETYIMGSGIPFTITKACGLSDGAAGEKKIVVGHDGEGFSLVFNHMVARDDVAHVLVEAIRNPAVSAGLRFDICSHGLATPTTDIVNDVLKPARFPWQRTLSNADSSVYV